MGCAQSKDANAPPPKEYDEDAERAIPAEVIMFSGCKDDQTSADVSNVASFGLPPVNGPEKAGGACTNALLSCFSKDKSMSFGDLLTEMQRILKKRKYTQIPQLSSSKQVNLKEKQFSLHNPNPSGRKKALLIGINYYGQQGELSGCVNDVKQMARFVDENGFTEKRILTDDQQFTDGMPTGQNIMDGIQWLVENNQPGDSLFFHYSGHGGSVRDKDGDEADGKDETLVPVDYQKSGQIIDDVLFIQLVLPLVKGVNLTAVMDCCHSGSILDLPYTFSASDDGIAALSSGGPTTMAANPSFSMTKTLATIQAVGQGLIGELMKGTLDAKSLKGALAEVIKSAKGE